ncbi:MAG TPA: CoA-binding protein, partial [Phycisphaerae bacterium]|nr:CoA-binding protein [Phycisphaerae bacterium]
TSADEAVAAAEEMGFPAVMKIVSPQIIHKIDVKGVKLNLADADAVAKAYTEMIAHVGEVMSEAEITGVLVRGMIPAGHEVILGAKRDNVFGPTLMFGLGGSFVEVFKDVTFALAPVDEAVASRMVRGIRSISLLVGARGPQPADLQAIEHCLRGLGQLVADFDRIAELDINPLIAGPANVGCAVADVRIRLS